MIMKKTGRTEKRETKNNISQKENIEEMTYGRLFVKLPVEMNIQIFNIIFLQD